MCAVFKHYNILFIIIIIENGEVALQLHFLDTAVCCLPASGWQVPFSGALHAVSGQGLHHTAVQHLQALAFLSAAGGRLSELTVVVFGGDFPCSYMEALSKDRFYYSIIIYYLLYYFLKIVLLVFKALSVHRPKYANLTSLRSPGTSLLQNQARSSSF